MSAQPAQPIFPVQFDAIDSLNYFVVFTTIIQAVCEIQENVNICSFYSMQFSNISVFAAQTYDTNDQTQFSMICETIPPAVHHLANRHAKLRLVGLCGPTNPSAGCFCSAGGNSSWHRMFSLCSDFVLPSDLCNRVIVQFWNLITRGLLLIKKRGQNKERDGDNLFLKSNLTVGSRCVWTTECRGIW